MPDVGGAKEGDNAVDVHKLTYFEALITLIRCTLGVGILSAPYAYQQLGWILAIVFGSIFMLILLYAFRMLINLIYTLSNRYEEDRLAYSRAMVLGINEGPPSMHKFAHSAELTVDILLVVYQFGIGGLYIVIIADSIKDVIGTLFDYREVNAYLLIQIPFLLIIVMIKSLKSLTPVSIIGNILTFTGLLSVCSYICNNLPPISTDVLKVHDYTYVPLFVGVLLLSHSPLAMILVIGKDMRYPKQYLMVFGVFNVAMFIVYVLFIFIGMMGSWRYGEHTASDIILNIAQNEIASNVARISYTLAVFLGYPLQMFPILQILWDETLKEKFDPSVHMLYDTSIRVILVLLTFSTAFLLPYVDIMISLFGCICLTILGIMFPGLLDICMRYNQGYGTMKIYLLRDIFLIIFGIACCVIGVSTCLWKLILTMGK